MLFGYLVGMALGLSGNMANIKRIYDPGGAVSFGDLSFPTSNGSGLPGLLSLALLAFVPFGGLIVALPCIKEGTHRSNRLSLRPPSQLRAAGREA